MAINHKYMYVNHYFKTPVLYAKITVRVQIFTSPQKNLRSLPMLAGGHVLNAVGMAYCALSQSLWDIHINSAHGLILIDKVGLLSSSIKS